jgi:hypothetical protein
MTIASSWPDAGSTGADGNDLRDEAAVLDAMRGCEVVVHTGAIAQ